jgi:signal transduction histidine kinase
VELTIPRWHSARSRLEESNRELAQFATVASHDLQEPLVKIKMCGSLLSARYGQLLDDAGRHYLETMQDAASRMQALIENLLALSRISESARPFVAVDLEATAREVVSDLEIAIEESEARISIAGLPTVTGDALQLRQLLQNLISNALKFARAESPPVVNVYARSAGAQNGTGPFWSIVVEDNGIGFEQHQSERIFEPFERLDSAADYEGTGIGLAICRRIARRHGGEVTANGVPGQGSTFTVTLPRWRR